MNNPGIYILTHRDSGFQYVGRDSNLPNRPNTHLRGKSPGCPLIHEAIITEGKDAFDVEIIRYPGISFNALCAVEEWKIKQLGTQPPNGYNISCSGKGTDPETSRRITQKRVADGTHNWLGFENNQKRVADGTHNWIDSESARENNRKRLENGTHNFLSKAHQSHANWKLRLHFKGQRRERIRLYATLLTSKSVLQEYRTRQLYREGFFDKDVVDTSNSEQLSFL